MSKVDDYVRVLEELEEWDQYLLDESCLPGPRANLELMAAVAQKGDKERFIRYMEYGADQAPYGSALEFLPFCGVVGLGRLLAEGDWELLENLRRHASDPRWRVREGVAMALQRFGAVNMPGLLKAMEEWSSGNLFERRAAAAGLCEPGLLKQPAAIGKVQAILDKITEDLTHEDDRRTEEFRVLRKALGYCWSVVAVAAPDSGKKMMEKWLVSGDSDIRWIMKENLKRNRLQKLDPDWTAKWISKIGPDPIQ